MATPKRRGRWGANRAAVPAASAAVGRRAARHKRHGEMRAPPTGGQPRRRITRRITRRMARTGSGAGRRSVASRHAGRATMHKSNVQDAHADGHVGMGRDYGALAVPSSRPARRAMASFFRSTRSCAASTI